MYADIRHGEQLMQIWIYEETMEAGRTNNIIFICSRESNTFYTHAFLDNGAGTHVFH
jgi:hypothetical protein